MVNSFQINQVNITFRAVRQIGASGGFITSFVETWFNADEENRIILYNVAVALIDKYDLVKFQKMCEERNIDT